MCPYTITVPDLYVLARDLDCPGDGITIAADNVHLVLAGHTLTGSGGGAGVRAEGTPANPTLEGLRIETGTVTGFEDGINVRNAPGARVTAVTATGNERRGIYVAQSPNARIEGNTATDNSVGHLRGGLRRLPIAGNRATGNARGFSPDGIQLDSTTGARVEGNTATGNGDDGLDLRLQQHRQPGPGQRGHQQPRERDRRNRRLDGQPARGQHSARQRHGRERRSRPIRREHRKRVRQYLARQQLRDRQRGRRPRGGLHPLGRRARAPPFPATRGHVSLSRPGGR